MKISKQWLNDFLDVADLSADQFCDIITTKVAEVDELIISGEPLKNAKVALVKSVAKHPSKDSLKVLKVHDGKQEQQVVCGATNVEQGMLAAYVAPGGMIYGKAEELTKIEAREVAGVESIGVLASEKELGISANHEGILNLSSFKGLRAGDDLSSIAEVDTVLEIDNKSLTHRPDLWSHFGFARELSAILARPLKLNFDNWVSDEAETKRLLHEISTTKQSPVLTAIDDTSARRFLGVAIEGISCEPSPIWIRRRLYSVGAGVRNLIVDLSNYVMLDTGQPNHTYDLAKLNGDKLTSRFAKDGEIMTSLDELERQLTSKDVVIADSAGAVALAGVIGGLKSSVTEQTSSLFLESANFDPTVVRLMTKRHTLRTDASNRFEKSQSALSAPLAILRYVELLRSVQPNAQIVGSVSDAFVQKEKKISIKTSVSYIRSRLDQKLTDETITSILKSLNFNFEEIDTAGNFEVSVPYYRATKDITIEDDLVEEVGRIYGYNEINELAPLIESRASENNKLRLLEDQLRDFLVGASFNEVYNYSFTGQSQAKRFGFSLNNGVLLQNPIDQNSNYLRVSLLPNFIDAIDRNARFFSETAMFELGRSYEEKSSDRHNNLKIRQPLNNPAGFERRLLAIGYSSAKKESESGNSCSPKVESGGDFYSLATLVRRLIHAVGVNDVSLITIDPSVSASDMGGDFSGYRDWMHPFRAASITVGDAKNPIGVVAELSPTILENTKKRVVVAEIDLELLAQSAGEIDSYHPISKFPDSLFEVSVVMPETKEFAELNQLIETSVPAELLRTLDVISVYKGAPLKDGEKSVSIQLSFGADDRTLGNQELTDLQNSVIKAIESNGLHLRS